VTTTTNNNTPSGTSTSSSSTKSPYTGDDFRTILWCGLMLVSGIVLCWTVLWRRTSKHPK
jgi:hypothetical protein